MGSDSLTISINDCPSPAAACWAARRGRGLDHRRLQRVELPLDQRSAGLLHLPGAQLSRRCLLRAALRPLHSSDQLNCGGILQPRTCLVFDPVSGTWERHSTLDQSRISSTVVNLPQGLFLIGDDLYDETTSSFLPNGSTEWVAGPKIPGAGATGACALPTGETSFFVIGGRGSPSQVVEYHTDSDTWTQWPDLVQPRKLLFCAQLGGELVIAGGEGDPSTTIMDLVTREQRAGGDLITPR